MLFRSQDVLREKKRIKDYLIEEKTIYRIHPVSRSESDGEDDEDDDIKRKTIRANNIVDAIDSIMTKNGPVDREQDQPVDRPDEGEEASFMGKETGLMMMIR